ncbi:hypothetical protein [Sphingomonas changnyeongensis]|uniref:hypothetical protein n=1 Tax=Sphingomonas changnyeongensis TaxID=2698679 RepID=UPI001E519C72|nr:hypothetical protein [Sphingomonas changnyeongensis]
MQAHDARARRPLAQIGGKGETHVGALRRDTGEDLAIQRLGQAAHRGLDFGKFGHRSGIGGAGQRLKARPWRDFGPLSGDVGFASPPALG